MSISAQQTWVPRLLGALSGLLLAIPHLYPVAAPLQGVALLPILYVLAAGNVHHQAALAAGAYMGLLYALPHAIAMRMPVPVTLPLLLYTMLLMTAFAWVAAQLLRGPAIVGAFAVGALLVVLDWLNFSLLPIWGTAQSFVRPWSRYPGLILFVSFAGITGILFALGIVQALLIKLLLRPRRPVRLLAAVAAVASVLLIANFLARRHEPIGKLKVAALGWTLADSKEHGGVQSPEGFDALFAQPVAQAASLGARLIVSPETGFYFTEGNREKWLDRFREIARRHGIFLAIGYDDASNEANRLLFINPEGRILEQYTKTHLIPFEDYRKGTGRLAIVNVEGIRVGGMICQDDNFTDLSRGYGRAQVGIVAVPTNDWLAVKSAHFQSSIHRAIECRYAVVRAAMNGISAIISPHGEVLASRDHFVEGPGSIVAEVPVYAHRTLFSILGHWPVPLSLLFLVAHVGWHLLRRGGFPRTLKGS